MDHGISGFSSENFSLHSEGGCPKLERRCLTKSKHYSEKLLDSGRSKVDEGEWSSCQEPITELPDGRRGGQLPPKQEEYPPMPRPGDQPHVVCQHCSTLLAVPRNLPSPRKFRCGVCTRISNFSVPRHSTDQESHGVLSKLDPRDVRPKEGLSDDAKYFSGQNVNPTRGVPLRWLEMTRSGISKVILPQRAMLGSVHSLFAYSDKKENTVKSKAEAMRRRLEKQKVQKLEDELSSLRSRSGSSQVESPRSHSRTSGSEKFESFAFERIVPPSETSRTSTTSAPFGVCTRISNFSVPQHSTDQESHGELSKLDHRDVRPKEGLSDDAKYLSGQNVNLTRGLLLNAMLEVIFPQRLQRAMFGLVHPSFAYSGKPCPLV